MSTEPTEQPKQVEHAAIQEDVEAVLEWAAHECSEDRQADRLDEEVLESGRAAIVQACSSYEKLVLACGLTAMLPEENSGYAVGKAIRAARTAIATTILERTAEAMLKSGDLEN